MLVFPIAGVRALLCDALKPRATHKGVPRRRVPSVDARRTRTARAEKCVAASRRGIGAYEAAVVEAGQRWSRANLRSERREPSYMYTVHVCTVTHTFSALHMGLHPAVHLRGEGVRTDYDVLDAPRRAWSLWRVDHARSLVAPVGKQTGGPRAKFLPLTGMAEASCSTSCSGGSKLEKSLTVTGRTKDRSARQLERESVTEGPGRSCDVGQPRIGGTYELNVHPTPPRPELPVPLDVITPQLAPRTPVSGTVLAEPAAEETPETSLSQYVVYCVMLGFIGAPPLLFFCWPPSLKSEAPLISVARMPEAS